MDGWMEERTDGRMYRWIDRQTDAWMDDRWTDRRIDGWMDDR